MVFLKESWAWIHFLKSMGILVTLPEGELQSNLERWVWAAKKPIFRIEKSVHTTLLDAGCIQKHMVVAFVEKHCLMIGFEVDNMAESVHKFLKKVVEAPLVLTEKKRRKKTVPKPNDESLLISELSEAVPTPEKPCLKMPVVQQSATKKSAKKEG